MSFLEGSYFVYRVVYHMDYLADIAQISRDTMAL